MPEEQDIVEGDVCAVPVHRGDERRVIDLGSHSGYAEHRESSRVSSVLQIFSDIISSVADPDPVSGAFLTPGSGMNILDHNSESLKTNF